MHLSLYHSALQSLLAYEVELVDWEEASPEDEVGPTGALWVGVTEWSVP